MNIVNESKVYYSPCALCPQDTVVTAGYSPCKGHPIPPPPSQQERDALRSKLEQAIEALHDIAHVVGKTNITLREAVGALRVTVKRWEAIK